jgi:type II secretory pathway pseudopilin PulG
MTLAELAIAVAIIGVALVALSSAVPIAAYGIQEGNQLSTATFLAGQRMEQARVALWQRNPPVDTLGVSVPAAAAPVGDRGAITFPDETPVAAPYAGYHRSVRITSCGVAPGCSGVIGAGLRQVTVTVTYRPMTGVGVAAAGAAKSAVLTMYIGQR